MGVGLEAEQEMGKKLLDTAGAKNEGMNQTS